MELYNLRFKIRHDKWVFNGDFIADNSYINALLEASYHDIYELRWKY